MIKLVMANELSHGPFELFSARDPLERLQYAIDKVWKFVLKDLGTARTNGIYVYMYICIYIYI